MLLRGLGRAAARSRRSGGHDETGGCPIARAGAAAEGDDGQALKFKGRDTIYVCMNDGLVFMVF